jgi:hypothetical protein
MAPAFSRCGQTAPKVLLGKVLRDIFLAELHGRAMYAALLARFGISKKLHFLATFTIHTQKNDETLLDETLVGCYKLARRVWAVFCCG